MNHLSQTIGYNGSVHPSASAEAPKASILWLDGVGGYLMLDRDDLLLGQAGGLVDIGIVGDISRQAAVIRRRSSDYFLDPIQTTRLSGQEITGAQLLSSGALISWGSRLTIKFTKPHPLSSSARLEMISLHRFQPRVDGILLLADSCILGPSPSSHVRCNQWSQDLLMFRQSGAWFFRPMAEVEVDGKPGQQGPIPLRAGLRMRGADFSLSIE
jgi:hypothetical protein